jgi:DNA-binding CsgD family transcriptional regulator
MDALQNEPSHAPNPHDLSAVSALLDTELTVEPEPSSFVRPDVLGGWQTRGDAPPLFGPSLTGGGAGLGDWGRPAPTNFAEIVLDAIDIGVVVCQPKGEVLFANLAARERLARRTDLVLLPTSRRLSACSASRAADLSRIIAAAAAGAGRGALLLSDDSLERTLVVAAPAGGSAQRPGAVLVLIRSTTARQPEAAASEIQDMFGLTRSEALVAGALSAGASLAELTNARGVSESTLRTQLGSIFRKADVSGQRELVRILGLIPPLR